MLSLTRWRLDRGQMRSEWREWPDPKKISWPVADGMAEVVYRDSRGSRIRNTDGSWSPKQFTYIEVPSDKSKPYFVMECEFSRTDLVPRITAFHVMQREASREVRLADLRHVRLEDALEAAWSKVTIPSVTRKNRVSPPVWVFQELTEQDKRKTLRGLRSQNRRKITPNVHQKVAEIWLADSTGAPTKAVADHFGLAPSTASLYVKRARDAGLLPPPPKKPSRPAKPTRVQPPASAPGARTTTRPR